MVKACPLQAKSGDEANPKQSMCLSGTRAETSLPQNTSPDLCFADLLSTSPPRLPGISAAGVTEAERIRGQ